MVLYEIASSQQTYVIVALVDAKHALDPQYAATLGVNVDSLLISEPNSGEMSQNIVDLLVRRPAVDIVVVNL